MISEDDKRGDDIRKLEKNKINKRILKTYTVCKCHNIDNNFIAFLFRWKSESKIL